METVESIEGEETVRQPIENDQTVEDENENSSRKASQEIEEADMGRSSAERQFSPRKVVQLKI